MTYAQLLYRCQRIIGMFPRPEQSLWQVMSCLDDMRPWARAIASECIARELAAFVEEQKVTYANL